ncbi:MAG TPA: hypothetical protein VIY48_12835 [Candidatus Paceibacterota bacterium]
MKYTKALGYGALAVALLVFVYTALRFSRPTSTSTHQTETAYQTLNGTLISVSTSTVVLDAQMPPLGTITVAVGSTTTVTKDTSLSPDELKAAYAEYQRLQSQPGSKWYDAPPGMKVATSTLMQLQKGDTLLITLTASSTKDHFTATRVEVLPAQVASTTAAVPMLQPKP